MIPKGTGATRSPSSIPDPGLRGASPRHAAVGGPSPDGSGRAFRAPGRAFRRAAFLGTSAIGLVSCATPPEASAVETLREAEAAVRAGDLDRAAELAERAHAERPGFVDPLFLLASLRTRAGRMEDARSDYRRILAVDPTSTAAATALAQTYIAEGRLDDAADWLLRAVEEDPGAEAAAFNLGSLSDQRGAPDDAVGWFALAGTLDRRDPRAPTHIARIRLAQGRIDEARRAADEAVRRAPDYARARQVLAAVQAAADAAGPPAPPR